MSGRWIVNSVSFLIWQSVAVFRSFMPLFRGRWTKSLSGFLCRAKEKTPQLLDIVQHGWVHANHSLEAGTNMNLDHQAQP